MRVIINILRTFFTISADIQHRAFVVLAFFANKAPLQFARILWKHIDKLERSRCLVLPATRISIYVALGYSTYSIAAIDSVAAY